MNVVWTVLTVVVIIAVVYFSLRDSIQFNVHYSASEPTPVSIPGTQDYCRCDAIQSRCRLSCSLEGNPNRRDWCGRRCAQWVDKCRRGCPHSS